VSDVAQVVPQADTLLAGLSGRAAARLAAAVEVARRQRVPLYIVGGSVRDLILGRPSPDLDLVIEGDAIGFASELAREIGGTSQAYREFLTAVVSDEAGEIDVATARAETYRRPRALPEVQPADLATDLNRRDFSVNTLVIDMGQKVPRTLDLLGGFADLQAGRLRILHARSFVDDPTRILRGIRFEQRLGFHFDEEAESLARGAVADGVFDDLSGSRLREELRRLLGEPRPGEGLRRLDEIGILAAIHRRLRWSAEGDELLRSAERVLEEDDPRVADRISRPRLVQLLLAAPLERRDREEVADRLLLEGSPRDNLVEGPARVALALDRLGSARLPHQVVEALQPLDDEETVMLYAVAGPHGSAVLRTHRDLCRLVLTIRGSDLLAEGIAPGPALGEALRATWRARIDGVIGGDEELGFAVAWLRGSGADGETPPYLRRPQRS
jgi:tRNA nucleotidyltransferase (CCA-adding enzyme)